MLLGFDIGSSSVKVALVDPAANRTLGTAQYPETEMLISAPHPDWAEQNPDDWWEAACIATKKLLNQTGVSPEQIRAIGIGYQMHGLVCVDAQGKPLRPAIIWCDSRAVEIGERAFTSLGSDFCLSHYLNTPGNFTASKLRWVRENEPDIFARIHKIMLPGDYVAFRMSGEIFSTISGLSEGILWDFASNMPAKQLMEYYEMPSSLLPDLRPTFGLQGTLQAEAAVALGLSPGIPISYRAGDQPNNALALNVLRPGEVAASGGTSGVVYAVSAKPVFDIRQRVNSFAHVNYTAETPLTGVLLCINGAGSLYRWVRSHISDSASIPYTTLEKYASEVPIGSEGLSLLPFGNGAERMLGNQHPGAQLLGLHFNRHRREHIYRAALEGIAFAFVYGMEALRDMEIPIHTLRVGNDNLFQSAIFAQTIATGLGLEIEVYAANGAVGAARAAGVYTGVYASPEQALERQEPPLERYNPIDAEKEKVLDAYRRWRTYLNREL